MCYIEPNEYQLCGHMLNELICFQADMECVSWFETDTVIHKNKICSNCVKRGRMKAEPSLLEEKQIEIGHILPGKEERQEVERRLREKERKEAERPPPVEEQKKTKDCLLKRILKTLCCL